LPVAAEEVEVAKELPQIPANVTGGRRRVFGRSLRDNLLGRPENRCNLDEMLILWGFGVYECFGEV
jgi:hypothetical protein